MPAAIHRHNPSSSSSRLAQRIMAATNAMYIDPATSRGSTQSTSSPRALPSSSRVAMSCTERSSIAWRTVLDSSEARKQSTSSRA